MSLAHLVYQSVCSHTMSQQQFCCTPHLVCSVFQGLTTANTPAFLIYPILFLRSDGHTPVSHGTDFSQFAGLLAHAPDNSHEQVLSQIRQEVVETPLWLPDINVPVDVADISDSDSGVPLSFGVLCLAVLFYGGVSDCTCWGAVLILAHVFVYMLLLFSKAHCQLACFCV